MCPLRLDHTLISLAAALTLGVAGCGSVSPTTTIDAAPTIDAPPAVDAALTWAPFELVGLSYAENVRTPVPSGDGLTLYFLAQLSGTDLFDIYSASRPTTSAAFGAAAAVANVNVTGEQARYPEVSDDGLELYYSKGDLGSIMVATRPNVASVFSAPTAVAPGVVGNFASISGDKLALYYITQVSGINGMVMRITRAAVGQAWSAPSQVMVTGAVQVYSSIDISSDELSLLRAPTLSPLGKNVLVSRRASKTAAFDQTDVLQAIDVANSPFGAARWSAHDTEIWAGGAMGAMERPYVSRLR